MSQTIFSGLALRPEHFDSDVARLVFNEQRRRPVLPGLAALEARAAKRLMAWLESAPPKSIMRWSRQIDIVVVPLLSPSGFREMSAWLAEHLPQAIENMPNTLSSVTALVRAVHFSRHFHPKALRRIRAALEREGLRRSDATGR